MPFFDAHPNRVHRGREEVCARRRLTKPEGEAGGLAPRVGDPNHARLDPQNLVRHVAELEDVACHALDREVLVQRTDAKALGLEAHLVVEVVWNGPAVGDRGEARASSRANVPVDLVVMKERASAAAARGEALRQDVHHLPEGFLAQLAVRPCPPYQCE